MTTIRPGFYVETVLGPSCPAPPLPAGWPNPPDATPRTRLPVTIFRSDGVVSRYDSTGAVRLDGWATEWVFWPDAAPSDEARRVYAEIDRAVGAVVCEALGAYASPQQLHAVACAIHRAMRPDGWVPLMVFPALVGVWFDGRGACIFYRKHREEER